MFLLSPVAVAVAGLLLAPVGGRAQASDPRRDARAVMEAAAEKQREAAMAAHESAAARQRDSLRRQVQNATEAPARTSRDFFTIAWPRPVEAVALPACEPLKLAQVDRWVREAARREGFTPDLLRAVIQRESGFDPCAVSSKGARGLMQLMPQTAEHFSVGDPFEPRQNIDAGARYLGQLLERYGGNLAFALGAYNAGPGRVDRFRGLPPIPETMNYVAAILEHLRIEEDQDDPNP